MRKFPAVVISAALATVALVGCTPNTGGVEALDCTPAWTPGDVLASTFVGDNFGADPKVRIENAPAFTEFERETLVAGTGTVVRTGEQSVGYDLKIVEPITGMELYSTPARTDQTGMPADDGAWQEANAPLQLASALMATVLPNDALDCTRAGDRLVFAVPSGQMDPNVVAGLGLPTHSGLIVVVDIYMAGLTKATGSEVFNTENGLPAVVRAPDGRPGVTIPDTDAPEQLKTQTLIAGNSADVVAAGDTMLLHFSGFEWADSSVIDSTWGAGTAARVPAAAVPAWFSEALVGQTVGSQVLIVAPGSVAVDPMGLRFTPGQPVVYVVDILGVL